MIISHHDLHEIQLWGGLAMAGLGALTLVIFWLAMVAGFAVRLFSLSAGRASVRRRKRGRRRVNGQVTDADPSVLLRTVNDDTTPIERVE